MCWLFPITSRSWHVRIFFNPSILVPPVDLSTLNVDFVSHITLLVSEYIPPTMYRLKRVIAITNVFFKSTSSCYSRFKWKKCPEIYWECLHYSLNYFYYRICNCARRPDNNLTFSLLQTLVKVTIMFLTGWSLCLVTLSTFKRFRIPIAKYWILRLFSFQTLNVERGSMQLQDCYTKFCICLTNCNTKGVCKYLPKVVETVWSSLEYASTVWNKFLSYRYLNKELVSSTTIKVLKF